MTRAETAQVLGVLRAAYPNFYRGMGKAELEGIVNLWQDICGAYSAQIVGAAIKGLISSCEDSFPPSIGQVMLYVRKLTEPEQMTEQEAWSLVKKAITRSGYNSQEEFDKLPAEIQAVIHTPETLKAWAIDENFNESVVSSNFMRSYRAKAKSIRDWNALPEDVKRIAISAGGGMKFPEPAQDKRLMDGVADG